MMTTYPAVPPNAETFLWGAEVFCKKGGFMSYSTSIALRVHSTDTEFMLRLVRSFGGSVSPVAGTLQWRLPGDPLIAFLKGITPHLPAFEERYPDACALVAPALEELLRPRPKRRGQAAIIRSAAFAEVIDETRPPKPERVERLPRTQKASKPAPPPPPVLRLPLPPTSAEEPFGRVPVGPWLADQVLFEMAVDGTLFPRGMLLEADKPEQAEAFAEAARTVTSLVVENVGTWVRLWPPSTRIHDDDAPVEEKTPTPVDKEKPGA